MKTLAELRAAKAKFLAECRALLDAVTEGRMSADNQAIYDKNMTEVDALNLDIARAEKLEAEERSAASVDQRQVPTPKVEVVSDPQDRDPKRGFRSMGDFYMAVINAGQQQPVMDKRLEAVRAESRAITGMGATVPSDGGFLVPEVWATDLMKNTYDVAAVTSKTRQVPLGPDVETMNLPTLLETSRVDGSRQGGVTAYWKAEGAQFTTTKPAFGNVKLNLNMMTGLTHFTDRLNKFSAIGLETFLNPLFAEEFAFKLDDACIEGTGAGQPLGILKAPALVTVAKVGAQDADTIVAQNILDMWARLPARSRANAVWFVNQDAEAQLDQMTIGLGVSGLAVYMPANGLSGASYSTLKGRPVVAIEQCSTLGDKGDIILADMSKYYYAYNSDGIAGATSIHLRFDYGEVAMRWEFFADGQPGVLSPVTPFKGSNTQSPFITLAERA